MRVLSLLAVLLVACRPAVHGGTFDAGSTSGLRCASDGNPEPALVTGADRATFHSLAQSPEALYFTVSAGPQTLLERVSKCGGAVEVLDTQPGGGPGGLLVEPDAVTWSTAQAAGVGGSFSRLWRTPLDGGATQLLWETTEAGNLTCLTRSDDFITFAKQGYPPELMGILRVPLTSGGAEQLNDWFLLPGRALVQRGHELFFASQDSLHRGVYSLTPGQAPVLVATRSGIENPWALSIGADEQLYWTETESFAIARDGTLWTLPLADARPAPLYTRDGGNLLELTVDAEFAWVAFEDLAPAEGVVRVSLDGGAAVDVVLQAQPISRLLSDEVALFWFAQDGVYRFPRPR